MLENNRILCLKMLKRLPFCEHLFKNVQAHKICTGVQDANEGIDDRHIETYNLKP